MMRIETPDWTISGANTTGHVHVFKGQNCHDAYGFASYKDWAWGVICDGCGSGQHSEVGAKMLCRAASREIGRLVQKGDRLPSSIPPILFPTMVRFIQMNLVFTAPIYDDIVEEAQYLEDYWLSTVLGFILHKHAIAFFHAGDGIIATDEDVYEIDQENTPHYLAYACLRDPEAVGVSPQYIPWQFDVRLTSNLTRFMVSTDGFATVHQGKLLNSRRIEPNLPDTLFGQQWGKKGQVGLSKWVNSRSQRGYFDDDCALIVAERKQAADDPNSPD